jgi:SOS-response transcriptional repressor LexA
MVSLTVPQQRALRFIAGFIETHGRGPSCGEMMRGLGQASKHNIHDLRRRLAERGAVRLRGGRIEGVRRDIAIPRAPDGAPLYFMPISGGV